jgi:ParB family chromosome partitioning protein
MTNYSDPPQAHLPLLLNADEAIEYYENHPDSTDAEKAYVVRVLVNEGFANKAIRAALGIKKVYTVTHFIRAGTRLSEDELNLWHKNPDKISLGHVRAIAKFPRKKREPLLRKLLETSTSVHEFESIAQGKAVGNDFDTKRYEEQMEEVLGRPIRLKYNKATQSGSLTVRFFRLSDLNNISGHLGLQLKDD